MTDFPDRSEAAEYYFRYIDQTVPGDVCVQLAEQGERFDVELRGISEARSLERYAPGKWSIRDVVKHISDAERLFSFRAFWFARGLEPPLPSYDEDAAVVTARADDQDFAALRVEFQAVRSATLSLFATLPKAAWERRGIASGFPFTVRALAFITVGHANHHMQVIRQRYLAVAQTG